MKILIAHESPPVQARVRRAIAAANSGARFLTATSLTGTYDLSEHSEPDCVVISEEMASYAEFELLSSLLAIMNIACIILTGGAPVRQPHLLQGGLLRVPERGLERQIGKAIQTARLTTSVGRNKAKLASATATYDPRKLILMGASTGGIDALLTVTQHFHGDCPPVLIVQHTGSGFVRSLIRLLNSAAPANVTAAENGTRLKNGHVYLAPDDQFHLTLAPGREPRIALRSGPAESGHRPSIDTLFSSALHVARHVSAALLTGMGKDGASGLTRLRHAGAHTIGQDQHSSVVYGMPRVAMEMGGVCEQLPIDAIGPALLRSCLRQVRV